MEMDMKDTLSDVYYSPELPDLDFDILHDITYDFNLLGEDDLDMGCSSMIKQEPSPSSRSDSSDISNNFDAFAPMDSPPLTPPSLTGSVISPHPLINYENESSNGSSSPTGSNGQLSTSAMSPSPTSQLPILLPALKSSRGRSASNDTPDVQALKRHIRMIRNRESASLSRKKKKEYLTGLESRIKDLEIENAKLKHENCVLKSKLSQVVSSSALNSAKNLAGFLTTNNKTKNLPAITAKVALLGLCCFAVVSYHQPAPVHHSNSTAVHSMTYQPISIAIPRESDVVSIPVIKVEEHKFKRNIQWKNSKFPGLAWRRHTWNDTQLNETGETLGVDDSKPYLNSTISETEELPPLNCASAFNVTEARKVQNDLKGIFSHKVPKAPKHSKPIVYSMIDTAENEDKGLQVYDAKVRRFSRMLDQLNRRSDTFYVVSLAVDNQLLLSARSVNATTRPKMTFLMPWKNDTLGGKEELMQIDCEVTQVYNLDKKNSRRSRKFAK